MAVAEDEFPVLVEAAVPFVKTERVVENQGDQDRPYPCLNIDLFARPCIPMLLYDTSQEYTSPKDTHQVRG